MSSYAPNENRIVVLTPTGNDAQSAVSVLAKAEFQCHVVDDIEELCMEISNGAGVVVIAEEAIFADVKGQLGAELASQEKWSDLPLLLITSQPNSMEGGLRVLSVLSGATNISFLQRPLTSMTLITAVRAALRSRIKQYEIRDLLQEQKRLTDNLQKAVLSPDTFMGIASHELNTPLTSLKLQAQMSKRILEKGGAATFSADKLHKFLDNTVSQVERLARLVDDMLDISRINSGKLTLNLTDANLSQIVVDVLERFLPQLQAVGCRVVNQIESDVWAKLDAPRIEQVLTNLITNVIKYAPATSVQVRVEKLKSVAKVTFQDGGSGISPENKERIFERFERVTSANGASGLGLGLYICRQIIQEHRGHIYVESEPGHGSAFIFEIPFINSGAGRG